MAATKKGAAARVLGASSGPSPEIVQAVARTMEPGADLKKVAAASCFVTASADPGVPSDSLVSSHRSPTVGTLHSVLT